jgi:hypothetical protein
MANVERPTGVTSRHCARCRRTWPPERVTIPAIFQGDKPSWTLRASQRVVGREARKALRDMHPGLLCSPAAEVLRQFVVGDRFWDSQVAGFTYALDLD